MITRFALLLFFFLSRLETDAMTRRCTRQLNYFITMYPTSAVWPPLWCISGSIRLLSMGLAKPTAQGPGKRSGYIYRIYRWFLHFPTVTKHIFSGRLPALTLKFWIPFGLPPNLCFRHGGTLVTKMFSAHRFALPVLTGRSFVWLRCVDYILSFMLMNLRSSSTTTRLGWGSFNFVWYKISAGFPQSWKTWKYWGMFYNEYMF